MINLSIIIPVYGVEDYVEKTLNSVFDTSAPTGDFEVIIVNDGTKDGSMDVVRKFADRPNLMILEQKNQGLSVARMKGVSAAKGEFVWFVDSDDLLVENGVGRVLSMLKERWEIDLQVFPIRWIYPNSNDNRLDYLIEDEIDVKGTSLLRDLHLPVWASPRFVFRRSLMESPWLFFPKGLLHEDEYFGPVLMYLSNKVQVKTDPVYDYVQRSGSIITSRTIRSAFDMVSIHKLLIRFMKNQVSSEDYGWFRQYCLERMLTVYRHRTDWFDASDFKRFTRDKGFYVWRQWLAVHPEASLKKRVGRLFYYTMPGLHGQLFGQITNR